MPLEGIRIAGLTAQGNGSCKCRWLMPDQCCQINWIDWASGGEGGSTWKGKKKKRASATRCRCWNMHESKVKSDCCCCWGGGGATGVGQAAARYHGLNAFIKTQNAHSGSPKKKRCNSRPFAMSCSKCLSRSPCSLCASLVPSAIPLWVCASVFVFAKWGRGNAFSFHSIPQTHTHTLTASSALATHWAFC